MPRHRIIDYTPIFRRRKRSAGFKIPRSASRGNARKDLERYENVKTLNNKLKGMEQISNIIFGYKKEMENTEEGRREAKAKRKMRWNRITNKDLNNKLKGIGGISNVIVGYKKEMDILNNVEKRRRNKSKNSIFD